jgi:hypothetical protein
MIETIKTYTSSPRFEGKLRMSIRNMYRCTKCGTIKPTKEEIKEHGCKNENSTM